MITALTIRDFRGIGWGRLDDLTPLVILVGPNGCGKSSVLDALLLGASKEPQNMINQVIGRQDPIRRNYQGVSNFGEDSSNKNWLFYKGRSGEAQIQVAFSDQMTAPATGGEGGLPGPLVVHTTVLHQQSQGSQIDFHHSSTIPLRTQRQPVPEAPVNSQGTFQSAPAGSDVRLVDAKTQNRAETIEDLYSKATRQGLNKEIKSQALELLKNAENIEILTEFNQPVLHINYPNYSVPMVLAGEGIKLYLRQIMELAAPANSTVLMEEPEANLSIRTMKFSVKAILAAMHRNIQIILTTHSLEFIDELIAAVGEKPSDMANISLFRLKLKDGTLANSRFSGEQIGTARDLLQEDLR